MKKKAFFFLLITISIAVFAQKPSKEQMEADKKRLAAAIEKLNIQTSKMDSRAKKSYDSLLNQYGVADKMDNAVKQVNSSQTTKIGGLVSSGIIPAKKQQSHCIYCGCSFHR